MKKFAEKNIFLSKAIGFLKKQPNILCKVVLVMMAIIVSNYLETFIPSLKENINNAFLENAARERVHRDIFELLIYWSAHYLVAHFYIVYTDYFVEDIRKSVISEIFGKTLQKNHDVYKREGVGRLNSIILRKAKSVVLFVRIISIDLLDVSIYFFFFFRKLNGKRYYFILSGTIFYSVIMLFYIFCGCILLAKKRKVLNENKNNTSNRIVDTLRNYDLVRANNSLEFEKRKCFLVLDDEIETAREYNVLKDNFNLVFRSILMVSYVIGIYLIYALSDDAFISYNSLLSFIYLYENYKQKISKLKDMVLKFPKVYSDMLEDSDEEKPIGKKRMYGDVGEFRSIQIEDVCIYCDEREIIKQADIKILVGEKIAITGSNGSGKSTIAKSILGMLDYDGRININGYPVKEIEEEQISLLFSYVSQESLLFRGSVMENLVYGNPNIKKEEVIRLCSLCGFHEFFLSLPNGYSTDVGDVGSCLSGGQVQIINFMRAIIKKTPVIILDEPTSNLDFILAKKLLDVLFENFPEKTIIYITHSLDELRRFEKIICVSDKMTHLFHDCLSMQEYMLSVHRSW